MRKYFLVFLICFTIVYVITMPIYAFSPASSEIYNGIDVSQWQKNIDFEKVKNSGIDVVYIKSSEGSTYTDPYFRQNYEQAKQNGLKVGFYHYVTARNVEVAIKQAEYFAKTIEGTAPDCMLAMDFESFGSLNNNEINNIALAFIQRVEELTNKKVVVYSNVYTARTKFNDNVAKYPLWVANYNVNKPGDVYKWDSWVGWQYTSTGKVDGINGNVDRDYFTKEIFLDEDAPIPEIPIKPENIEYITYKIKWGDTLSAIAKRYNTTVGYLAQINGIKNPNLIYAGNILKIPTNTQETGMITYKIKWGDTLSAIARRYNTTVKYLAQINGIKNPNLIYAGRTLQVPSEQTMRIHVCGGYQLYTVKNGDTLDKIAEENDTTSQDIVELNEIQNPNIIRAGEILRIYCKD